MGAVHFKDDFYFWVAVSDHKNIVAPKIHMLTKKPLV